MPTPRSPWMRELLQVLASALIATLVAFVDLKLWRMSGRVPLFGSAGDVNFFHATVKDVVEHGWFTHNPDLGAPLGQTNYDFAASFGDTLHYVLIKALAIPFNDPAVVFNAFFLLGFPLVAVSAHLVLRDLGASPPAALVMSVLFAMLPYHVLRNQGHLFLAAYYAVPLGVWLVVTLAEGRTLLDRRRRGRTAATLAVCAVVASASNYYAIFTMLALVLIVPVAALARASRLIAVQGLLVLVTIAAVFAACHAPVLVYAAQHGSNEVVAKRTPAESETYGLKLTHLVIPRPGHRIGLLARSGARYEAQDPLRAEGFSPSLGLVATLGLLGALAVALITGLASETASLRRRRISVAGALAVVLFIVGTVGGISAVIAFELSPQVRGWNRLSIFIGFAALLAAALALTALGERLSARGRPAWMFGLLAAVVGVIGVLDQTSARDAPAYAAQRLTWRSDARFVHAMEDRLPPGAAVLQLPYVSYPEHGPTLGMRDYDLFKGYLHSTRLRWSYGATKGRPEDWQEHVQALAPQELAAAATTAGFAAVYVDRAGYADGAGAVTAALTTLTGGGPTGASDDGRLEYFDLRAVAARIVAQTLPGERAAMAEALIHPVGVIYGRGFSYPEAVAGQRFRRAGADGELLLDNPLDRPRQARLTMRLFGGRPEPSVVTMLFPDGRRQTATVTDKGIPIDVDVTIPAGGGTLQLHTEGPAAPNVPGDIRDLRLGVVEPRLREGLLAADRLAQLIGAGG